MVSANDMPGPPVEPARRNDSPRRYGKCGAAFLPQTKGQCGGQGTPPPGAALLRRKGLIEVFIEVRAMSALGISAAKTFAISAYADVRHEQLVFERQQS